MTPQFKLSADGKDITAKINDRLLELTIKDEAGLKSDALELRLDDRDGNIALPENGAKLRCHLGYQETGLAYMGEYVIDELELAGGKQTISIRARAADFTEGLKSSKIRSFDDISLGDLVRKIAGEAALEPVIDSDKVKVVYKHIDQKDESDLHLLTRLAKDQDAHVSVKDGKLLLLARASGKSASGQPLAVLELRPENVSSWRVTLAARDKYKSVIASWHDRKKAKKFEEKAGSGEPVYRIKKKFPDQEKSARGGQSKV